MDAQNNVYITGCFYDIVDFDPGVGVTTIGAGTVRRAFTAKYTANRRLCMGQGPGEDLGSSSSALAKGFDVAVDREREWYILAASGAPQILIRVEELLPRVNTGGGSNEDIYIQKLDVNGNFIWVNTFGTKFCRYGL